MTTYTVKKVNCPVPALTGATEEQACKMLHVTPQTLRTKAAYHETIRGAWIVTEETTEPEIDEGLDFRKCYMVEEWDDIRVRWARACGAVGKRFHWPVKWLEGWKP